MNFGQLMIWLAFFCALGSALLYYVKAKHLPGGRKNDVLLFRKNTATYTYWVAVFTGILASVALFYSLLTHQFQYSYVAQYSSRSMPLLYLISAFWAGQEGTFLFWALLVSIMGVFFIRSSKEEDGYAMSVVAMFQAFLFLLLIVKSPFETVPTTPPDGSGMNPLLQDPWMAIHPPILFMGYAATVFPFALVVSALARRNYSRWFASGFAWTLFASVTLGAGIIIGGFWAYEVLGWGGYWGWDPVENSSLVPWMMLLALIHGLIVQKAKGSLVRTNIFFAILSFILVLYATFLTRSGVLADFSVHSFVDLGINNYLIGVMVASSAIGFGMFATRFTSIKSPKLDTSSLNRELALLFSMFVLTAGAAFTFFGMSSPIITGIFGKASQVDTSFYNKVNIPVAIGIALLLGVTPFLGWVEENKSAFLRRLSMPILLTALSLLIAYVAGVTSTLLLVFVGSAAFGLVSNVIIAFRQYRSGWTGLGGPIAHIGVALLLIGIVGSGSYDESTKLVLKQNEPQSAHGYQFTFKGMSEGPYQKTQMNIEVSDGRNAYMASPKLYYSTYNQSMLREPSIKILPMEDLYISPLEIKSSVAEHSHPTLELTKGETSQLGGYRIQFVRFETGQHGQSGGMSVGAVLNINVQGKDHELIPQIVINDRGERQVVPADLPSMRSAEMGAGRPQVILSGMNVEQKKVMLELAGFESHTGEIDSQELIVDISTKPLMMVVWTGVVLIIGGTVIAYKKRLAENPA